MLFVGGCCLYQIGIINYVVKSFGVSVIEGKDVLLDHYRGRRVSIYRYLLEGPTFSASEPGSENSSISEKSSSKEEKKIPALYQEEWGSRLDPRPCWG